MIHRDVVTMAWLVLVATACAADPPDPPGGVAAGGDGGRQFDPFAPGEAPGAAPVRTDSCTPIAGYDLPVDDRGGQAIDGTTYSVTAGDSFFIPTCVLRSEGGTVTLQVVNTGGLLHNVSVADQGIDVDVAAGETIEVDVEVGDEPVVFVCKYHRTAGMAGAVLPDDA